MRIFNKGLRSYTIKDEGDTITIPPQKFRDLSDKTAEKLIKDYPGEILDSKEVGDAPHKSNAARKVLSLKKENAILKERIAKLEKENNKKETKYKKDGK